MTIIRVPYGKSYQEAYVPDDVMLQIVEQKCNPIFATSVQLIANALDNPIGTMRLEEMVEPNSKVVIIVNDHTRPGPNAELVDMIMRRLEKANVPEDNIRFVIATGSHRACTDKELDFILGAEYHRRIKTRNHDCLDGDHVYLGTTKSGLPIWIDRWVAEADFIITTGLIAPHHAAGFSGGRKSIVPGVSAIDTLKKHHSLPIRPYEPAMGFFEGNPFHLTALEGAKLVNVRFIVNVVQNAEKRDIACVAGDMELAHEAGVKICRESNCVEISNLADIVITSPGGYPRDCNLYQSQKALSVAEVFAKKNECTFILCAQAEDGIGEGVFKKWLKDAKTPQEVIDRFRKEGFTVGNNKAFMYARALLKGKVIIVSDMLDEEELHQMKLGWAPTLQVALDNILADGKKHSITVLPKAISIIPTLPSEL